MPFLPKRVITVRASREEETHKYMIVSSADSSLILGINEGKISTVQDSGFIKVEPTIHVSVMEDGSYVQVTETVIIHVRSHLEGSPKNTKWQCDPGRKITMACSNSRQLAITVDQDQLIYFEVDDANAGLLAERGKKIFKQDLKSIDIGEVPEQRQRFKFLMVAFKDQILRILSLEPEMCLNRVSMQVLPQEPSDVALVELNNQLYLHIGMENGVLMRTLLDNITGGLSDGR
mmetsp:Transcript_5527/g.9417  ORF Transcript_5527/g.9417 Transcript_5527/m.9417 type:complete len:232 (-) Transcript_5527:1602-2297(-)